MNDERSKYKAGLGKIGIKIKKLKESNDKAKGYKKVN